MTDDFSPIRWREEPSSCSTRRGCRARRPGWFVTAPRRSPRRSAAWRCAARRRSASPRPTAWFSACSPRRAARRRPSSSRAPPTLLGATRPDGGQSALGARPRRRSLRPPRWRDARGDRRRAPRVGQARCSRRTSKPTGASASTARELFAAGDRVLTHCNAGALATAGIGTAVGVIEAAARAGLVEMVWVDETRPLLQGARLTAWEMQRLGIPLPRGHRLHRSAR